VGTAGSKVGGHNWKDRTQRITGRGRVWAIGKTGLQVSAGQQGGGDHSTQNEKRSIPETQIKLR
jgi:hypothetical protein